MKFHCAFIEIKILWEHNFNSCLLSEPKHLKEPWNSTLEVALEAEFWKILVWQNTSENVLEDGLVAYKTFLYIKMQLISPDHKCVGR